MKYRYGVGKLVVEGEVSTQKDLFQQLAMLSEIFGEKACGVCGSEDIGFETRTVDENTYFSMRCRGGCAAELSYGQHKTGNTLFAKRTEHPATNGWHVWRRDNVTAL